MLLFYGFHPLHLCHLLVQVKWAKLRGTPGSPPEKLAEAEREVSEAEGRLRSTKIAYEELVSVMTEELNRWQKERAADMSTLLRDFALAQVGLMVLLPYIYSLPACTAQLAMLVKQSMNCMLTSSFEGSHYQCQDDLGTDACCTAVGACPALTLCHWLGWLKQWQLQEWHYAALHGPCHCRLCVTITCL